MLLLKLKCSVARIKYLLENFSSFIKTLLTEKLYFSSFIETLLNLLLNNISCNINFPKIKMCLFETSI